MLFKCDCCGEIIEEDEAKEYSEYVGECFGRDVYKEYMGCPYCKGGLIELDEEEKIEYLSEN